MSDRMIAEGIFFIITFIILIISPFVFMFTKAHFHFEYLRRMDPDKFKKFDNYLDTSKNLIFNKHVGLLFPYFNRQKNKEETEEIRKLGEKVELFSMLIYIDIAFIVIYVVMLLVFFGDFS